MPLSIEETNRRAVRDPAGFIAEGDAHLRAQIALAADAVINNMARSRIVLLSGPSGSGKTTCAEMLEAELSSKGVRAHSIALDNYYDALPPEKTPLTPEGKPDLESPLFLDAQLLDRHFSCIERGESITVPTFDFAQSRRGDAPCKTLRVGEGEVAIFEGIHALNDLVSAKHAGSFRLYVSPQSAPIDNASLRLVRRTERDRLFRGADAEYTLSVWDNVRRGEGLYIAPFLENIDMRIDSSLPYELCVLAPLVSAQYRRIEGGAERFPILRELLPQLDSLAPISPELVPRSSLLREFIG